MAKAMEEQAAAGREQSQWQAQQLKTRGTRFLPLPWLCVLVEAFIWGFALGQPCQFVGSLRP
jgi:hypothetical protein